MHRFLLSTVLLVALIQGCACHSSKPGPVSLADGRSFAGWEGDTSKTWRIVDGAFVGGSLAAKVPRNEFLATGRNFTNFVLRLEFKLEGDPAKGMVNSGVQFHSQRIPDNHEMSGYQADLGDPGWWGSLYDESRRNKTLAPSDMASLGPALKRGDWNVYEIRAENGHIRTWINGAAGIDYREADPAIPQWGRIALQIHSGGPALVSFRNIVLEELPVRNDR
jgi:hypothetical protein